MPSFSMRISFRVKCIARLFAGVQARLRSVLHVPRHQITEWMRIRLVYCYIPIYVCAKTIEIEKEREREKKCVVVRMLRAEMRSNRETSMLSRSMRLP